jgi:hypothetical protein
MIPVLTSLNSVNREYDVRNLGCESLLSLAVQYEPLKITGSSSGGLHEACMRLVFIIKQLQGMLSHSNPATPKGLQRR